MTKPKKKSAKKKRAPRKDEGQIALSVVESAIGGKLVSKSPPARRPS